MFDFPIDLVRLAQFWIFDILAHIWSNLDADGGKATKKLIFCGLGKSHQDLMVSGWSRVVQLTCYNARLLTYKMSKQQIAHLSPANCWLNIEKN